MNIKMGILLNFFSFIAPTIWVVIAAALGFSVGAYGPKLLHRFKHDHLSYFTDSGTLPTVPKPQRTRRPTGSRRSAPNSSSNKQRRKRPSPR